MRPPEGGPSAPQVGPSTLVQASPAMLSTVSLSVKKQLDDKWAAAFYECEITFGVASLEAFRDSVEDTARLVRMPDDTFALVLTGLGAGNVGARRYTNSRRKRLGGDLLDDADTREQVSLKDAISPVGK